MTHIGQTSSSKTVLDVSCTAMKWHLRQQRRSRYTQHHPGETKSDRVAEAGWAPRREPHKIRRWWRCQEWSDLFFWLIHPPETTAANFLQITKRTKQKFIFLAQLLMNSEGWRVVFAAPGCSSRVIPWNDFFGWMSRERLARFWLSFVFRACAKHGL